MSRGILRRGPFLCCRASSANRPLPFAFQQPLSATVLTALTSTICLGTSSAGIRFSAVASLHQALSSVQQVHPALVADCTAPR